MRVARTISLCHHHHTFPRVPPSPHCGQAGHRQECPAVHQGGRRGANPHCPTATPDAAGIDGRQRRHRYIDSATGHTGRALCRGGGRQDDATARTPSNAHASRKPLAAEEQDHAARTRSGDASRVRRWAVGAEGRHRGPAFLSAASFLPPSLRASATASRPTGSASRGRQSRPNRLARR